MKQSILPLRKASGMRALQLAFGVPLLAGAAFAQTPVDVDAQILDPAGADPTGPQLTDDPEVTADDWTSIRAAYDLGRHATVATESGFEARNPGQGWNLSFDRRGLSAKPDAGAWTWGLDLVSYGFEGIEREVGELACASSEGGRVTYKWDDTLEEWYINDARGLEHGFTIRERPTSGDKSGTGPLTLALRVRGGLTGVVLENRRDVRFVDGHGVTALTYAGLIAFDADGRALPAWFEACPEGLILSVNERGANYPLTIDPVAQEAYLKASNSDAGDSFGRVVAISGDTVVVGAAFEDSGSTGINGSQSDNSATNAGAVYVFVRTGSTWSQQAYIKASNAETYDLFGGDLDISGDTLIVGANWEDSGATGIDGDASDNSSLNSGAAYVFTRSGTTWSQQAYLKAPNGDIHDRFGWSVSVSDDTAIVGAWLEDGDATGVDGDGSSNAAIDSGAAYVFTRSGSTWSQQAYLKASNPGAGDWFGYRTAVSGDTAVVTAQKEDSNATGIDGDGSDNSAANSGAAYVFTRSGTTWSQQAYIKASNTDAGDNFAFSMDISGDTLVLGAITEDSNATGVNGDQSDNSVTNRGAVYVFVRSGLAWSQQAYLKAAHGDANDRLGCAVSLSGDILAIGSRREDSSATGVGGDEFDNSLDGSGCAYLFRRVGTTWNQQAYIKASNPGLDDRFGDALAISGTHLIVGAWHEESNATGIDGDQLDNSMERAGAVYTFPINSPPVADCLVNQLTDIGGVASVSFSATDSTDVEDDGAMIALTYDWTISDGATTLLRTGEEFNESLGYGNWTIALTVTDSNGDVDTSTCDLTIDPANLSVFDCDKLEVKFCQSGSCTGDKIKISGEIGLPMGVQYTELNAVAAVALDAAGGDFLGTGAVPILFEVHGGNDDHWKYRDDAASAGITKLDIDWKGARFKYKEGDVPVEFQSELISSSETVLTMKYKMNDAGGPFVVDIDGVLLDVDADGLVTSIDLPPGAIEVVKDGKEVDVTLPFPLIDSSTVGFSGAFSRTVLVSDHYTTSLGRFKLEAESGWILATGADTLPRSVSLMIGVGGPLYPGSCAAGLAELEIHGDKWKAKN